MSPLFPRTTIENLSVSRMIIGTNWFLGYSHQTTARDQFIKHHVTPERAADIIEVFMRAGVDAILGGAQNETLITAVQIAQDRVGTKLTQISIPTLDIAPTAEACDANARLLDREAQLGVDICMPHQCTTDALLDRTTRSIRRMDRITAMIRERNMVPGLSTHMPETPVYADQSDLDVATYIQIYNAAGFLMQVEVEWVHKVIHEAKKPVITIKPMAAGRLSPLVGMTFAWASLREQDMVAVGTMTPDEARELIDLSLSILDGKASGIELQRTRSKESIVFSPEGRTRKQADSAGSR